MHELPPKKTEKSKPVLKGEELFRLLGDYSPEEFQELETFMHQSFPHLTYGGGRDKPIIVEFPPRELCDPETWKEVMEWVLVPELGDLDLVLKRSCKIIVRFTGSLYDPCENAFAGAVAFPLVNEIWIRVALTDSQDNLTSLENCVFKLMHEIAEEDFWSKTLPDDKEALEDAGRTTIAFQCIQEYRRLLDEKIANRRAFRAVRRFWPTFEWFNPREDTYEEDLEL